MVTEPEPARASRLVESIAEQIVDVYLDSAMGAMGRLPAEREMAGRFSVSRGTVRHALQHLAAQGTLINVPKSGWYSSAIGAPAPRGPLLSLTESAALRGSRLQTILLQAGVRRPTEAEAVALRLAPEERVFELRRARLLERLPMCVEHHVIAVDRAPGIEHDFDQDASLYALLERHGVTPIRSDLTASAALAGSEGEHLGIDPGAPVLIEDEVVSGAYGRPFMLARGIWRADRYQFFATYTRSGDARTADEA